tara:strand:- start:16484 stop:16894 length:411 start_codon:yes stop_codon:yes gene_type:complete
MDKIRESKTKVEYNGERIVNPYSGDMTAIEYCEKNYPETVKEYKRIMWEQYETFCKKHRNYGPSNISVGTQLETNDDVKLSLTGLWFRINDKIQRLKQLVVFGQPDEVGESISDTYADLSVYGIIAQIVKNGKWGK